MPTVLIVEDSPVDRALVEGILAKNPELALRQTANGVEALAALGESASDVIVTDLQMPEMDGLALVTAVRLHFPQIPVILITAHGSEELAVRALEQGAASYVPKSQLAVRLLAVVDQVLDLARSRHGYEELAQAMQYAELRFELNNDLTVCDRLVELVQQVGQSVGVCDTGGQVRIGMALEEAHRMLIFRGNLEAPPDLLPTVSTRQGKGTRWLAERRAVEPYCRRKLRLHLRVSQASLRLEIAHDGPGLTIVESDAASSTALESPADRSLILMRAFMDEVKFSANGKTVTLVKSNPNA